MHNACGLDVNAKIKLRIANCGQPVSFGVCAYGKSMYIYIKIRIHYPSEMCEF